MPVRRGSTKGRGTRPNNQIEPLTRVNVVGSVPLPAEVHDGAADAVCQDAQLLAMALGAETTTEAQAAADKCLAHADVERDLRCIMVLHAPATLKLTIRGIGPFLFWLEAIGV